MCECVQNHGKCENNLLFFGMKTWKSQNVLLVRQTFVRILSIAKDF